MRLLVIDGNSIANRAFFGIKLLTTKDGRYTNAIYGFLNILLSLLKECEPDEVAVAFDLKAPTFRHKMYDGYKATRHGMPEELAQQMQQQVQQFLEEAAGAREAMLDATAEEMRDLALATAEKIIHVSLKSSSDVVMRMVLHATEKLKRREWVNVYIAGCDLKGTAQLPPSLTTALAAVSDHVKIIPIADDESGTCIIEMPDEIIDASAGTQLSNIRDRLAEIPLR